MKLYNSDGNVCNATKDQLSCMLDAGWSKTPPDPVKKDDLKAEADKATETTEAEIDGTETEVDEVEEVAPKTTTKSSKTLKPGIKKISKRK